MNMKVVINGCFGGFRLSPLAEKLIAKRKGNQIVFTNDFTGEEVSFEDVIKSRCAGVYSNLEDLPRDDVDLVAVVEELGEKASTSVSELYVVEIPDDVDWVIEEYDGLEHVAEKHETWQ